MIILENVKPNLKNIFLAFENFLINLTDLVKSGPRELNKVIQILVDFRELKNEIKLNKIFG